MSKTLVKTHSIVAPPLYQSVDVSALSATPWIKPTTKLKQRMGITSLSPNSQTLFSLPFLIKVNAMKAVNGKYLHWLLSGTNAITVIATKKTAKNQFNQLGYVCVSLSAFLSSISCAGVFPLLIAAYVASNSGTGQNLSFLLQLILTSGDDWAK